MFLEQKTKKLLRDTIIDQNQKCVRFEKNAKNENVLSTRVQKVKRVPL